MAIDLGSFKGDKGDQGDPGPAGTTTTVLGTANQVVVNTVDTTATVSLDTDITSAIADNTDNIAINTNRLLTKGDGLSITNTTTLNLLDGTTVISSVTLPTSGGGGGTGVSDYNDLTNAPITTRRTIDTIVLDGTRSNVITSQGGNEMSTITMLDSFDPGGPLNALVAGTGITYRDSLTTGDWRIIDSGFNLFTLADGSAWTAIPNTIRRIEIAGDYSGTFLSTGDLIRLTVASGSWVEYTGTITASANSLQLSNIVFQNSSGTVSGISAGGTANQIQLELSRSAISSFVYNPDTANTVITGLINRTFTTPGPGINTHLTYIANQVTPHSALITWDGIITPTTLTRNVVSRSDTYRATISFTASQWAISQNVSPFNVILPTTGDAWSTINNTFIVEDDTAGGRLFDVTEVGDTVRLTFGAGSASFPVIGKGSRSTEIGVAFDIVGTIGITFTDLLSIVLQADVTSAASSITLDLGTEVNINSNFTLTGGINNSETLVNTDGAPTSTTGVSSTITITDGFGSEVTSFTASVPDTSTSNIDSVGQQIADAVNNNTETPIDFSATYTDSSNTLVLTGATAGVTSPWVISINNNNADPSLEGDISISSQSQDYEIINQIDTLAFPDGTSFDTAYPTEDGTYQLQISGGVATWVIA